ncbi:MAG: GIY-YIG nuclease family protein [Tenuifilaceae bacterium]|nr:GIY-YIG nuclease family protein [Tenuifilaceae bacterium]
MGKENIMQGIYKWTNLINNKVYIGQASDIARRVRGYRSELNKNSQRPIIRALRKYGFENFKFEILEEVLNKEDLLIREQSWIDFYDSKNREKGYNILDSDQSPAEIYSIGSNNVKARLNEEKVLIIRDLIYNMNIPPAEVYKIYSNEISYDAFCKAYRGETWKNVDLSMIKERNILRKGQPKAKLSKVEVADIRYQYEILNKTINEIFEHYIGRCTRSTIKRVVNYETWKDILPNPVSTIP